MTTPTQHTAHTPGPWYWQGTHGEPTKRIYLSTKAPNHFHVLMAAHVENKADARLIAAAPDLLEACKAAIEWDDHEGTLEGWARIRDLVINAIARAEQSPASEGKEI